MNPKSILVRAIAVLAALFQFLQLPRNPWWRRRKREAFSFAPADGVAKQMTQSGRDSAPVLSPDGRWIIFVRAVPGKTIGTGSGDVDAAELGQIRADGNEPTLLVSPRAAEDPQNIIASFQNMSFSADGRHVFFVTPAYATSGAVHAVDTTNRKRALHHGGQRAAGGPVRRVQGLPAWWSNTATSSAAVPSIGTGLSCWMERKSDLSARAPQISKILTVRRCWNWKSGVDSATHLDMILSR